MKREKKKVKSKILQSSKHEELSSDVSCIDGFGIVSLVLFKAN